MGCWYPFKINVQKYQRPVACLVQTLRSQWLLSILLVPVRVVDELPVHLLGLLVVEFLAAVRAWELAIHLDAHVLRRAIAGLGRITDFHIWTWRHREVLGKCSARELL
ncbi:unnamed protein product [Polarella glacialis]|uniref:Uncharacterized protein n=1 Tax=Polarella glacialis TaxID=89957 RepID=A0A813HXK8_POLGL|nr:unnamed protein product [Polarella glacialis]